jgi:hypothetical protein
LKTGCLSETKDSGISEPFVVSQETSFLKTMFSSFANRKCEVVYSINKIGGIDLRYYDTAHRFGKIMLTVAESLVSEP